MRVTIESDLVVAVFGLAHIRSKERLSSSNPDCDFTLTGVSSSPVLIRPASLSVDAMLESMGVPGKQQ